MFIYAASFLVIFTALYLLAALAVIYHLRQYTIPGQVTPKLVLTVFYFFSALCWLLALTFLFKIPH